MDYQGGKRHGEEVDAMKRKLEDLNQEMLADDLFKDIDDVEEKLEEYKNSFMEFDSDRDLLIGVMDMKQMMEKMGQAKTHLEVMKMIREVDKENKDAINYREFVDMMLGTKTTVLKLILKFEQKVKDQNKEVPKTPPAKKTFADLP